MPLARCCPLTRMLSRLLKKPMLKSLYARPFFFCFLSIAFVTQVFLSIRQNAPTADEYAHHIASGLSRLVKRDFRLNPPQPPPPLMMFSPPLARLKTKNSP